MNLKKLRSRIKYIQLLVNDELHRVSLMLNKEFEYHSQQDLTNDLEFVMQGNYPPDCPLYINQRVSLLHVYVDSLRESIIFLTEKYPGESIVAPQLPLNA